jgi:hypothetical protein
VGGDSEAIEQFGKDKEDWLRRWLDLENGIPSHNLYNAGAIARIELIKPSEYFITWVKASKHSSFVRSSQSRSFGITAFNDKDK